MSQHPIRITNADDGTRSRLTVFFRFLLATPHFIWLEFWAIGVVVVSVISWFATLFTGRNPEGLHRFSAAFLRYATHVYAFLLLIGNPFPGFTGAEGSYPIDLHVAPPERQNRWKTFFRLVLVLPAAILFYALGNALYAVALLGWFAALATGRMPSGLQRLGVYLLRYQAQMQGYMLLLTDRYPYSGPEPEWSGGPTDGSLLPGGPAPAGTIAPPATAPAVGTVPAGPAPGTLAAPAFRDAPQAEPPAPPAGE